MRSSRPVRWGIWVVDDGAEMCVLRDEKTGPWPDENPKLVDVFTCDNWNEAKRIEHEILGFEPFESDGTNTYYWWGPEGDLRQAEQEEPVAKFHKDQKVRATRQITEGGGTLPGDPTVKMCTEDAGPTFPSNYIHAEKGELGVVIYISAVQNIPTVRFERTGTATVVDRAEIEDAT